MVSHLHNTYAKSVAQDKEAYKNLIDKLVYLTQITICSDENDAQFEHLMTASSAYKNFVALVEFERDSYKKVCVEFDNQEMPWNAEVHDLKHHVRGDSTSGF